jgi:hypothetical protein
VYEMKREGGDSKMGSVLNFVYEMKRERGNSK